LNIISHIGFVEFFRQSWYKWLMSTAISILPVFVVIAAGITAIVLVLGLFSMASEGEFHDKYSNLLMRARVSAQGATIALLVLLAALTWLAVP